MARSELTQKYLKSVLDYNTETGIFTWKYRPSMEKIRATRGWNKKYSGKIAGNISRSHGYREIVIDYNKYLAHRLAWFYFHGRWPVNEIDHKNLDRLNNSLNNLREATSGQNKANLIMSTNTSGYKGVSWSKRAKRWRASMSINNKSICIGHYDNKEDAYAAYCESVSKRYGNFERIA